MTQETVFSPKVMLKLAELVWTSWLTKWLIFRQINRTWLDNWTFPTDVRRSHPDQPRNLIGEQKNGGGRPKL